MSMTSSDLLSSSFSAVFFEEAALDGLLAAAALLAALARVDFFAAAVAGFLALFLDPRVRLPTALSAHSSSLSSSSSSLFSSRASTLFYLNYYI
jgi:hypothetical protein